MTLRNSFIIFEPQIKWEVHGEYYFVVLIICKVQLRFYKFYHTISLNVL